MTIKLLSKEEWEAKQKEGKGPALKSITAPLRIPVAKTAAPIIKQPIGMGNVKAADDYATQAPQSTLKKVLTRPSQALLAAAIDNAMSNGSFVDKAMSGAEAFMQGLEGKRQDASGAKYLAAKGIESPTVRDIAGSMLDFGTNPVAGALFGLGGAAGTAIGGAAKVAAPTVAPVAGRAIGAGLGFGSFGGLDAAADNATPLEIAKRVAIDTAIGVGTDLGLQGLGALGKAGIAKLKKPVPIAPEIIPGQGVLPQFPEMPQPNGGVLPPELVPGIVGKKLPNVSPVFGDNAANLPSYDLNKAPVLNSDVDPTIDRIIMPQDQKLKLKDVPKAIIQAGQDAYTALVDNLAPAARAVKAGKPVNITDDFYRMALNSRNAQGTANYILNNNLVDRAGNVIGEGLANIEKDIPRGFEREFADYLLNKHNVARMAQNKPIFGERTTAEQSAVTAARYEVERPEFKMLSDRLTAYIRSLSKVWGIDSGLVDKDLMAALTERYPNYVPTYRQQTGMNGPKDANRISPAAIIKDAKGGDQPVINPVENIKALTEKMVTNARKNEIYQGMQRLAEQKPDTMKRFYEKMPVAVETEQVADIPLTVIPGKGRYLAVRTNGKVTSLKINDDRLWQSLQDIAHPPVAGPLEKGFRAATNPFKALITGDNPLFAAFNFARDVSSAYTMGSENNPIKFAGNMASAAKGMATNSKEYRIYKALGGGNSNFMSGNAGELPVLGPIHRGIKGFNNAVETLPRFSEYKGTVNRLGDSYEARQQGIFNANDVTTNFAKHGNVGKTVDSFVPYLNPSLQGLERFARSLTKPSTWVKAGATIAIPAMAQEFMYQDNPHYQQLSNRTKDTYYLIPNWGDVDKNGQAKTFIKVPKARDTGVLFGALLQRVVREAQGDPNAWDGFGNTVATGLAPASPVENNIAAPLVYNIPANKDFAGRTIISQSMEKLRATHPELMYDENTSEPAKFVGEKIGYPPKLIDYLIRSYTGVIGHIGLPLTTANGSVSDVLAQKYTADPTYSNDVINNFYNRLDTLESDAAAGKLTSANVPEKAKTELAVYRKMSDDLSQIRKLSRAIENSDKFTPERKEELQRKLQEYSVGLAARTNKYFTSGK